jgi:hypothetical protein
MLDLIPSEPDLPPSGSYRVSVPITMRRFVQGMGVGSATEGRRCRRADSGRPGLEFQVSFCPFHCYGIPIHGSQIDADPDQPV